MRKQLNFELSAITVSLYDQESLMITDYKKEYAIINYKNNKKTSHIKMVQNKSKSINHMNHVSDVVLFTSFS